MPELNLVFPTMDSLESSECMNWTSLPILHLPSSDGFCQNPIPRGRTTVFPKTRENILDITQRKIRSTQGTSTPLLHDQSTASVEQLAKLPSHAFVEPVKNCKADLLSNSSSCSLFNSFGLARLRKNAVVKANSVINLVLPTSMVSSFLVRNSSCSDLHPREADIETCKLCLEEIPSTDRLQLERCGCVFCRNCMKEYADFEIRRGITVLSCPDAKCCARGILLANEIRSLVSENVMKLHSKFVFVKGVENDPELTWCPTPDCDGVCKRNNDVLKEDAKRQKPVPEKLVCPLCKRTFCIACRRAWETHEKEDGNLICPPGSLSSLLISGSKIESHRPRTSVLSTAASIRSKCRKKWAALSKTPEDGVSNGIKSKKRKDAFLRGEGLPENESAVSVESASHPAFPGFPSPATSVKILDPGLTMLMIKECPNCFVPIERNAGCAQMMCRRCNHIFCWFCLAPLDGDFLLRHYSRGPCKDKLGHSRAAVIWYRAQVVALFLGFGLLTAVAAPVILIAAPCLLACGELRRKRNSRGADEEPVVVEMSKLDPDCNNDL
ncbi:unnamed protein product [Notodromas monacha]|uniref:RBR-type E3 ubiquitin transferase n=1 Tax=Notodromas monacha TaxID=399045 RepID=A0A7R9GJ60_9CRUS|nr:unnamed protein product [Notodromas monacha]CAG0923181.1 unnamed protein product [Notodromas monacha]